MPQTESQEIGWHTTPLVSRMLKTQLFTRFRGAKPATLKNTHTEKQFVTNKENKNFRK